MVQPITLPDITARDYSPAIDRHGEVVTDLEDIRQSILIILTTERGSVPLHPRFGASLIDFVDRPINTVTAALVQRVYEALSEPGEGEPRVDVTRVEVDPAPEGERSRFFHDAQAGALLRVLFRLVDTDLEAEVFLAF